MGYTTEFYGKFELDPPLNGEQQAILAEVAETRHENDGAPELYCQWIVTAQGAQLEWDQGEKFYAYTEWLDYLITHYFVPWGVNVTGEVTFQGEDNEDTGVISVVDNIVYLAGYKRILEPALPLFRHDTERGDGDLLDSDEVEA